MNKINSNFQKEQFENNINKGELESKLSEMQLIINNYQKEMNNLKQKENELNQLQNKIKEFETQIQLKIGENEQLVHLLDFQSSYYILEDLFYDIKLT